MKQYLLALSLVPASICAMEEAESDLNKSEIWRNGNFIYARNQRYIANGILCAHVTKDLKTGKVSAFAATASTKNTRGAWIMEETFEPDKKIVEIVTEEINVFEKQN